MKCIHCGVDLIVGINCLQSKIDVSQYVCQTCTSTYMKKYYLQHRDKQRQRQYKLYRENIEYAIYQRLKYRAKKENLEFNLEPTDIVIPTHCPVFNTELIIGPGSPINQPSVDRIDNTKGYIKGNIIVVSLKANTIKNNATVEELEKVYNFYKKLTKY